MTRFGMCGCGLHATMIAPGFGCDMFTKHGARKAVWGAFAKSHISLHDVRELIEAISVCPLPERNHPFYKTTMRYPVPINRAYVDGLCAAANKALQQPKSKTSVPAIYIYGGKEYPLQ